MVQLGLALLVTVLGWMDFLVPGRDHTELAWAITSISASRSEAALLTAMAYRESSLDNGQVGDHGSSFCAMQINISVGGSRDLLSNPRDCVSRAAALLRASMRTDPLHPVANYARGPRWRTLEAQRISNDRVALANRLLRMYL